MQAPKKRTIQEMLLQVFRFVNELKLFDSKRIVDFVWDSSWMEWSCFWNEDITQLSSVMHSLSSPGQVVLRNYLLVNKNWAFVL